MLAQGLDVGDEVPGGVVDQAAVRLALAAAALIEQDDAVFARVEEAPHAGLGAAAGAAVQEHDRLPLRIAGFLPINTMDVRNPEHTRGISLEWRIEHVGESIALFLHGRLVPTSM